MNERMTGTHLRAAGADRRDTAARFLAWLAADANPALTKIIQSWLCQRRGAQGDLATTAWDVALLRAEVLAAWPPASSPRPSAGRAVQLRMARSAGTGQLPGPRRNVKERP